MPISFLHHGLRIEAQILFSGEILSCQKHRIDQFH